MNPIIQKLNFQKAIKISKSKDSKPKNYQEKQNTYKTTLQINIKEREKEMTTQQRNISERLVTLKKIIHGNVHEDSYSK